MKFISEEIIAQVSQSVDIVDVIGQYVQLRKQGTNYLASCPFHEDRHPSFSVSQTKQIYKCFSCGRGGNVFGFLQEMEGISFPEAVVKAADFGHVTLAPNLLETRGQDIDPNQSLYRIHDKARDFYHYYLMNTQKGEEAHQYLLNRGLEDDTLKHFELGAAPDRSELLYEYLMKEGFEAKDLIESGIFYQNTQDQWVDRFKGRVIIPLKDKQGRVVGFSGRLYQKDRSSQAKYLNSPQTAIFNKSEVIYNLHGARSSIRKNKQVFLCEGYMDVIALYQAGYHEAVASMGTSLTRQQLQSLSRLASTIYILYDGDGAGQEATRKAYELAQGLQGSQVKSVTLPQGMDPDEYIKAKGRDAFQNLLNHAFTSYEFYQHFLKGQFNLNKSDDLADYLDQLLDQISLLQSSIEQTLRLKELAKEFSLSHDILQEQLDRKKYLMERKQSNHPKRETTELYQEDLKQSHFDLFKIHSERAFQSEKLLLFTLIYYESAWDYLESFTKPPILYHKIARQALTALSEYYYDVGQNFPLTGISQYVNDSNISALFNDVMWDREIMPYHDQILDDCMTVIHEEFINQQIEELSQQLRHAENQSDKQEINALMVQIMRLKRQLLS